MTMHLVGPYLTTTGRRKGRQKFRNAAQAQQARELKEAWEKKQQEWSTMPKLSTGPVRGAVKSNMPKLAPPPGRETPKIPSVDSGIGNAAAPQAKVYTGTKMIGIGTMHKSNSVPIFSEEEAVDIAHMRR